MSTGHVWRKERAARDLAQHLELIRARIDPPHHIEPTEDARTTWKRRLQQRRCLVCGARDLVNRQTSYFCQAHIADWRYCSTCETLRTAQEHGRDSRCKGCANVRGTAAYYADKDRTLYRRRLTELAKRRHTRSDQLFEAIRRRIALAELVKNTPGMSWAQRGRLVSADPTHLAESYRKQCRGDTRDADNIDRSRSAYLDSR